MMTSLERLRVLKDVADRQPSGGYEASFDTCLARAAASEPRLAEEFGGSSLVLSPSAAPWFVAGSVSAMAFAKFFGIHYDDAVHLMGGYFIENKRSRLRALVDAAETTERLLRRRDETVAQLAALTDAPREKADAAAETA